MGIFEKIEGVLYAALFVFAIYVAADKLTTEAEAKPVHTPATQKSLAKQAEKGHRK